MEHVKHFLSHLQTIPWPFLMVRNLPPEKVRVQKIWEGIVIAIMTALITTGANSYVTMQIMDAKLSFIQQQVRDNHNDIRDMRQKK